ncbi:MAG: ROK family glucokinase [Candidatus Nanopelagicales bacterium]|nr:ROK family glucokinase [Candidatus Nanopelagicales bacterium]
MSLTIGIDIGGTKIAGGVVDEDGTVLRNERRRTPSRSPEGVEAAVIELVLEFKADYDVEAVGIGAAGFVDENRSRVLLAPNLGWVDEPLRMAIQSKVDLPVVVENDANAAAWGEFKFGGTALGSEVVCVTVGTGIGGGLILGGQLYRGAHGIAAELGHLGVEPGGRLCGCGNRGCWEQYASGNALVRDARLLAAERRLEAEVLLDLGDGTPEGVEGQHITLAARKGDPVALAAFDSLARWLGTGLADLAAILDPGCFVIGGGVSEAGDLLLGATRRAFIASVSGRDNRPMPEIVLATLVNEAGLVGAADLARYR